MIALLNLALIPPYILVIAFEGGGATFALECGVPPDLIQSQGDWRSQAYQSYLDPSLQSRLSVTHVMAQAISTQFPSHSGLGGLEKS